MSTTNGIKPSLMVRTQRAIRQLSDVAQFFIMGLDEETEMSQGDASQLNDEHEYALIVEHMKIGNDFLVKTLIVGFYTQDAANQALDRAAEVLTHVSLYGTPATSDSLDRPEMQINHRLLKDVLTLDLRQILASDLSVHTDRQNVNTDTGKQYRTIELNEPDSIDWLTAIGDDEQVVIDFRRIQDENMQRIISSLGVPREILEGTASFGRDTARQIHRALAATLTE